MITDPTNDELRDKVLGLEAVQRLAENAVIHHMVVGGSRGYGLATPSSDIDISVVYVSKHAGDLLGITQYVKPHTKADVEHEGVKYDLNFLSVGEHLKQLRSGTPQAMETLHTLKPKTLLMSDPYFNMVSEHGFHLSNSAGLVRSALGILWTQSNIALTCAKAYKSAAHALRVGKSVITFLKSSGLEYPVDYTGHPYHGMLVDIRQGADAVLSNVRDILQSHIEELRALEKVVEPLVFDDDRAVEFYQGLI